MLEIRNIFLLTNVGTFPGVPGVVGDDDDESVDDDDDSVDGVGDDDSVDGVGDDDDVESVGAGVAGGSNKTIKPPPASPGHSIAVVPLAQNCVDVALQVLAAPTVWLAAYAVWLTTVLVGDVKPYATTEPAVPATGAVVTPDTLAIDCGGNCFDPTGNTIIAISLSNVNGL